MAASAWRFLNPFLHRKCRVLFAGEHFQAGLPSVRGMLERRQILHRVELVHAPTRNDLLREAGSADVALPFMEHFDTEFFTAAAGSKRLRLIQQFGVGLERVDVGLANGAEGGGIAVANVPAAGSGNAEATAEHALMLGMMLLRHVRSDLPRRLRDGELGGLPLPGALYGKHVTVVGYGSVGSLVCRYLVGMGAKVTVVRRRSWCPVSDKHVLETKLDCIKEALPSTELLMLCCTVTAETWHLMNEETIGLLPEGALIVNVARGPLVEYNAILSALDDGRVGGFASDVGVSHESKPSEPWDPSDELSLHPRAIFTPHVAGYCDLSYGPEGKITEAVVEGIECILENRPPPNWVNKPQNEPFS